MKSHRVDTHEAESSLPGSGALMRGRMSGRPCAVHWGHNTGWADIAPKDVHVLVPGAGKRDFADGMKLRILRWRDDSGLSRWVERNHWCP